jgi:hypothetical protein
VLTPLSRVACVIEAPCRTSARACRERSRAAKARLESFETGIRRAFVDLERAFRAGADRRLRETADRIATRWRLRDLGLFFISLPASHIPCIGEQITARLTFIANRRVLLTNSSNKKKPGPKEVDAGGVFTFAHQAYWGFRFLAEKRKTFWKQILDAGTVRSIQEVGQACLQKGAMSHAGYGAKGLMTWLTKRTVALQVLKAKQHRRYPNSNRPSSADRRMIFLSIAVAAGVWEIEYSTALRKLARANLGIERMAREVHSFDRLQENMVRDAVVMAEPVENYFFQSPEGEWRQVQELPCEIPPDFQGGFIVFGHDSKGKPEATFSRTLPSELADPVGEPETDKPLTEGDKKVTG